MDKIKLTCEDPGKWLHDCKGCEHYDGCDFFNKPKKGGTMTKPELELSGQDGNAFAVIGRATKVARRARWNVEEIKKFQEEAMAGDYNHVLQTCMKYFDVS